VAEWKRKIELRLQELETDEESEDKVMKESILEKKRILAVDDEPDVLTVLEQEIHDACPSCRFEKAMTYEGAVERISSRTYDLVILDAMGALGSDLLGLVMTRNLPVAILTVYAIIPETLRERIRVTGWACLPREGLGEIVPLLEKVLRNGPLPGGRRSRRIWGLGNIRFEPYWKKVGLNWREWEKPQALPDVRPGLLW
jgi:CheY-like chemotaxis protein